jgi:2-polyprenyl-3-methyl-5-hydroxy-6-metoxy-1,4-benzoquinol methylase
MQTFREKLIEDYGKTIIQSTQFFNPREYERSAKRYAKIYSNLLPRDKTSRIGDVGCGDGHFLFYLKKCGYHNIEGVDASKDRIALCRQYVVPDVWSEDAITWLKERSGVFDLLSCHHVIEHIPDDGLKEFLNALLNALKPDGTLILTTPNACTPWAGYNHYHDLTHVRLFTADSITQLMASIGLSCECYPEGAVSFDLPSSMRTLVWKIREYFLKLDYRIQIGGTRGNQKTPLIVSPNLIAVAKRLLPN